MMIINEITVDLAKWEELPQIDMKQFDANTRAVRVTLLADEVPWTVPEGVSCSVAYFKDGEQLGWYDTLADGSAACSVEGNVVTAILAPQVLALPGFETVSVQFRDSELDQLGTFSFLIWSEPNLAVNTDITNVYYSVANLAQLNAALEEINTKIAALETGGGTEPVEDYVTQEAERVAALVQSHQNANTISFLACSDLHYSDKVSTAAQQKEAMLHLGQAMKQIRQSVHIDFAVMLGDMIWDSGESTEEALAEARFVNACLADAFQGIPNFRTRGNHDCGYNSGAGLTDTQIYGMIGIFNEGAEFEEEKRLAGYCYRDFEDAKLRVICLNSSESAAGGSQLSATQVAWLEGALDLTEKGDGWQSLILSHHPLDWGKDGGVNPLTAIGAASGVIGTIHGHTHNFRTDDLSGTSVLRMAIPNACFGRENEYTVAYGITYGEDVTYGKTAGTAEDTSFCVVTIDLAEQVIYADHYGAGYDRVVSYAEEATVAAVTYQLENAVVSNGENRVTLGEAYQTTVTAAAGYKLRKVTVSMGGTDLTATAYKDGVITIDSVTDNVVIHAVAVAEAAETFTNLVEAAGYTDDTRLSTSSPYSKTQAGYVSTGYIPYDVPNTGVPPVIYIQGADWDATSNSRMLFFAEEGGTLLAPQINGAGSGNQVLTVHYDMEMLGEQYFKLTPIVDADSSYGSWHTLFVASTVADAMYFRMSLAGSGANLIITVDEPIE